MLLARVKSIEEARIDFLHDVLQARPHAGITGEPFRPQPQFSTNRSQCFD